MREPENYFPAAVAVDGGASIVGQKIQNKRRLSEIRTVEHYAVTVALLLCR